ncbi:TRAP transporter substrate-binding protein [Marinobacterium aestuariivivens]|uniref:TRAP transporter substrate-binding protein n=1 Tax=Marinobacterium aestuariivivens TaxID=1698799 RepID=A0ABW2A725_9GAMM
MNKHKSLFAGLYLSAGLALAPITEAADVNLRFAHFWPASSGLAQTLALWGETVEKESNGRIQVEMYPSQTLAKAPKIYDSVVAGIADIGATIQGYTANRFPQTQIVELPGLVKSAEQGSCIVQTLYDEGQFKGEYDDAQVLFMFTHGPGHIHTHDKPVTRPSDLAGMLIRRPTVVVGELLTGLGGEPIGLPAPEMYGAMQRGVINGVTLPWEAMGSFRLNELAEQHTEIGLYTTAFVVAMNKRVYDELPDDLKKVIDDNSGLKWADKLGTTYDELDVTGREQAKELNHSFTVIEGGVNNPDWKPVLDQVTDSYLKELEAKGKPANAIYQRAQALSESCSGA